MTTAAVLAVADGSRNIAAAGWQRRSRRVFSSQSSQGLIKKTRSIPRGGRRWVLPPTQKPTRLTSRDMASQSKTQLVGKIHGLLRKEYKPGPAVERMSVLEAVVYAICHEGAAREQANQALSRFKDQFFDWNEVRVSSLEEIQATLADLPDRESRAFRIRRFLRQLFSKTFSFSLEALAKKPQKEAIKILGEYEALASDYVEASVILYSLGGHAIPLDAPSLRRWRVWAFPNPRRTRRPCVPCSSTQFPRTEAARLSICSRI